MAAQWFSPPSKALDSNADPYAGAKWKFYVSGTLTPQAVYADADLETSLGATVTADSAGKFANIYFDADLQYRAVCLSADEATTLHDIDPVNWLPDLSVFNVVRYGAVGSGSADDTDAIQAAVDAAGVNGGTVFFPPGLYRTTDTVTITRPNVRLLGSGDASLVNPFGDFGDVFHAYPASGVNLQGFRVESLYVYAASETTSGAILHLENCNGFRVDHCRFSAHYGGIHLDGAVHGYIDADVTSDANFTVFRSGSFLCKATKSSSGRIPAEIHVAKADWRGQNGNYRLNYSVLIQCADGIWFDTPHFGFSKVGMALNPSSNSDTIVSVIVDSGYLDTCSTNLLQVYRNGAGYSADFGLHRLDFATMYNSGEHAIDWNCTTSGNAFWSTISMGNMLQAGSCGLNITLGEKLFFTQGWAIMGSSYFASGNPGIAIGATASQISIMRGTVDKQSSPNTPPAAVTIANGADAIVLDVIHAIGCTTPITDSSVTANKSIASAVTW